MTFTGDQIHCYKCGKPKNMNNCRLEPLCECDLTGIMTTFSDNSIEYN